MPHNGFQNDQACRDCVVKISDLESRLSSLENYRVASEEILKSNTETLKNLNQSIDQLRELLETWNNAKGVVRTLSAVGNFAKWLISIAAACAIMWGAFKWAVFSGK